MQPATTPAVSPCNLTEASTGHKRKISRGTSSPDTSGSLPSTTPSSPLTGSHQPSDFTAKPSCSKRRRLTQPSPSTTCLARSHDEGNTATHTKGISRTDSPSAFNALNRHQNTTRGSPAHSRAVTPVNTSSSPADSGSPSSSSSPSSASRRRPMSWTAEEDAALTRMVQLHGARKWKLAAQGVPGRTSTQCSQRWRKVLAPNVQRYKKWTQEEDALLVKLRLEYPGWKNSKIATYFPGRTTSQCWNRWNNVLNPDLRHGNWSEEEDALIKRLRNAEITWATMAKEPLLHRRSQVSIKNRWRKLKSDARRESKKNGAGAKSAAAKKKTTKKKTTQKKTTKKKTAKKKKTTAKKRPSGGKPETTARDASLGNPHVPMMTSNVPAHLLAMPPQSMSMAMHMAMHMPMHMPMYGGNYFAPNMMQALSLLQPGSVNLNPAFSTVLTNESNMATQMAALDAVSVLASLSNS